MSSIKLSPNASGTGIFTIAAPNSNTDRTLTLPDQTGTVLTNAGPFTANASASAGAVTIDASNNVGIGTSSPANFGASFKSLQVDGSSYGLVQASSGTVIAEMMGSSASSLGFVGTRSNHAFVLRTNDTERARIDSSGNLMFGRNSVLNGNTYYSIENSSASINTLWVQNSNASDVSSKLVVTSARAANSGYVFIDCGANFPTSYNRQFMVRGDGVVFAQNTTIQSLSDARVKENVRESVDGLNVVSALRPVRFDFKSGFGNDRKDQLGFIAQEVEAVFPDAVDEAGEKDEDGLPYKSVGPGALIPVLVKAIQEQQAFINDLTARIAALEAQP